MIRVETLHTQDATDEVLREIRTLLDAAFDGELTEDDWMHTCGGTHVVVRDGEVLVAHAAVVARLLHVDGRPLRTGYVEGVATRPDRQGEGHGRRAMAQIAVVIRTTYELGALSTGLHEFYGRLGWERWQGPTFVRIGDRTEPTPDDDDGLMVLRFDSTADVRLDARLTCEHRAGDVW